MLYFVGRIRFEHYQLECAKKRIVVYRKVCRSQFLAKPTPSIVEATPSLHEVLRVHGADLADLSYRNYRARYKISTVLRTSSITYDNTVILSSTSWSLRPSLKSV